MSYPNPNPNASGPYQQPTYAQPTPPYGNAPYGAPPPVGPNGYPIWRPPVQWRRVPLNGRQKSASAIAGALGFLLMSLGFWTVVGLAFALFMGAFMWAIVSLVLVDNPSDLDAATVSAWFDDTWSTWWWVYLLIGVAAIGLWILGYLMSISIMRSADVNHPVGVTWAGLGISVAAWLLLSLPLGLVSGTLVDLFDPEVIPELGWTAGNIAFGVIWIVPALLLWVVIGALSWWWMAHGMRKREPVA